MPPGYRYTPAFSLSPSQLTKKCQSGANDREEITGSAATFAAKFPAALERAAHDNALDPRDLANEQKWVIEAVRTCAAITPQLALSTRDLGGIENFKYKWCAYGTVHASGMVSDNWDDKRDWGVDVLFIPPGGSWKNQGPFKVSVTLTSPGRNPRQPPYTFVSATVHRGS